MSRREFYIDIAKKLAHDHCVEKMRNRSTCYRRVINMNYYGIISTEEFNEYCSFVQGSFSKTKK